MDENQILNTIKQKGIKPLPRSHFLIRRYGVIFFGILVTILGAIIFSKIIASILVTDWESWDYVYDSFSYFVYFSMPIAWVLLLVLFIFLTPYIFEKTVYGYRYKRLILVLFSILVSFILSLVILKVGAVAGFNKIFIGSAQKNEIISWVNPAQGRLAGYIESRGTDSIIIKDYMGKIWAVDVSNVLPASKYTYQNTDQVRIVGIEIDDNTFVACQIMPTDFHDGINFEQELQLNNANTKPREAIKEICSAVLRTDL